MMAGCGWLPTPRLASPPTSSELSRTSPAAGKDAAEPEQNIGRGVSNCRAQRQQQVNNPLNRGELDMANHSMAGQAALLISQNCCVARQSQGMTQSSLTTKKAETASLLAHKDSNWSTSPTNSCELLRTFAACRC